MKINAIITGTTGMVGEGVLLASLEHPDVEKVLVINRKSCGVTHPKLNEIIHSDFSDLSSVATQLKGYNACFFCLGVSSVGMKEDLYYSMTYTLTMYMAEILSNQNPVMTFCYISGAGTDGTEKGRINWARVKGKTENDLMRMPFIKVFVFRPAFLEPSKDQKNIKSYYKFIGVLAPVVRFLMPNLISTIKELGLAMINSVTKGYEKPVLEVKDIIELAKR